MAKKIQIGERDQEILYELKRITRLLGVLAVRESKTTVEKIALLAQMGFSKMEIASILGITSQTVSIRLSEARVASKRKQRTKQS